MIAVTFEHIWVRRKLDAINRQEEFYRIADAPMRAELIRISDFNSDVSDWARCRSGFNNDSIQSFGQRVSRKLNQTINLLAGSNLNDAKRWLEIDTEHLDDALASIDHFVEQIEPNTSHILARTICTELDRIEQKITQFLSDFRPR